LLSIRNLVAPVQLKHKCPSDLSSPKQWSHSSWPCRPSYLHIHARLQRRPWYLCLPSQWIPPLLCFSVHLSSSLSVYSLLPCVSSRCPFWVLGLGLDQPQGNTQLPLSVHPVQDLSSSLSLCLSPHHGVHVLLVKIEQGPNRTMEPYPSAPLLRRERFREFWLFSGPKDAAVALFPIVAGASGIHVPIRRVVDSTLDLGQCSLLRSTAGCALWPMFGRWTQERVARKRFKNENSGLTTRSRGMFERIKSCSRIYYLQCVLSVRSNCY